MAIELPGVKADQVEITFEDGLLCRLVLDRRRLAAWASAWSLTGPRWSTRR